jgi:hypothetical protein
MIAEMATLRLTKSVFLATRNALHANRKTRISAKVAHHLPCFTKETVFLTALPDSIKIWTTILAPNALLINAINAQVMEKLAQSAQVAFIYKITNVSRDVDKDRF